MPRVAAASNSKVYSAEPEIQPRTALPMNSQWTHFKRPFKKNLHRGLCHQQQSWAPAGFFSIEANSGMHKSWRPFLIVTIKTQVFTVTINTQNTLQHFQGALKVPSKHFFFFEGGACVRQRGACAMVSTMASPSLNAIFCGKTTVFEAVTSQRQCFINDSSQESPLT